MATFRLTPSLVRSRFGRRLFGLFVLCSLLPALVLGVLSFGTVTRQLRRSSQERLEHSTKLVGKAIEERLQFLSQDLARVGPRSSPCPAPPARDASAACDGSLDYGVSALAWLSPEGKSLVITGDLEIPKLTAEHRAAIESGIDVVVDAFIGERPVVYLARGMGGGVLIARIDPAYLWSALDQGVLVPSMQFHVANASSRVISERNATRQIPPLSTPTGHFDWDIDGKAYLAAFAPIGGTEEVLAPAWTLVISEARQAVVAPMDDFRRSFPLAITAADGERKAEQQVRHAEPSRKVLGLYNEGVARLV